jgi:hypothetical protein
MANCFDRLKDTNKSKHESSASMEVQSECRKDRLLGLSADDTELWVRMTHFHYSSSLEVIKSH